MSKFFKDNLTMQSISTLEHIIRDLINRPRKHYLLFNDKTQWFTTCSSLDVIGDTDLAIKKYLKNIKSPASHGVKYVLIYGLLQVLYVQQDAVTHLIEGLKLSINQEKMFPNRNLIRDIRNSSIGHPTKRTKNKEISYNFLSRGSMTRSSFTLITYFPNAPSQVIHVDLLKLIKEQNESLKEILSLIIEDLKKEELDHRNMYKNEKIAAIFPDILSYYYENIERSVTGVFNGESGARIVDFVEEICDKFKEALVSRDIYNAYKIEDDFELLKHALRKLKEYLNHTGDYHMIDKDGLIYLSYIRKHIGELQELARTIDCEYECNDIL